MQYDPSFTEDDTLSGRAHAKNALINAFVRGGNKERFNPDDLRQTYQLHLNVERIRVPETWFQPSMFGHDSAGLGEIAGWVMGGFEEEQRKRMMQVSYSGRSAIYIAKLTCSVSLSQAAHHSSPTSFPAFAIRSHPFCHSGRRSRSLHRLMAEIRDWKLGGAWRSGLQRMRQSKRE